MNKALIDIRHTDDEITGSFTIIGEHNDLIPLLHQIFRASTEFKSTVTEALLTFDTEAGGQTMNLETTTPSGPPSPSKSVKKRASAASGVKPQMAV